MSEKHIPQDIMEAAQNAFEAAMSHQSDTKSEVEIALAILAERERCVNLLVERSQDVRRGHVEKACYANAVALISRGAA